MAGLVILEFCTALILMFLFPPLSLGLIFVGLATVALAVVGSKCLSSIERRLAASFSHDEPSPHHLERGQDQQDSEFQVFIDDQSGPTRA